ncbi:MAG: hypothetical protein WB643_03000 [Candidatus Bathyarchaeia archaeon]
MLREFWKNLVFGWLVAIAVLTVLELITKDYWQFVVLALVGWSTADLTFKIVNKQPAVNVRDFLVFLAVIIVATTIGAWLSNALLQGMPSALNVTMMANATVTIHGSVLRLDRLISVLIINSVAAVLAFLASSYDVRHKLEYGD